MLGKFLRSLRKSKKLTQNQLAANCGLSKNRVIDVERGENAYSVDKLAKYAASMGFEVEIAFYDKEDHRNIYVYKPKIGEK